MGMTNIVMIFHQMRLLSASSSQTLNTSEMGHWQLLWTTYTRYSQHLFKSILPYTQPVSTLFQFQTVACQGACQGPSGWLPFPQSIPSAPLSLVPPTDLLRVLSVSLCHRWRYQITLIPVQTPEGQVLPNLRKKNRTYKSVFKIKITKLNIISYCHLFWGKYADFLFGDILPYFLALVAFIWLQKTSVIPVIMDILF